MSNIICPAFDRFHEIRKDFHATKKVGQFFSALLALSETDGGRAIWNIIQAEYNFEAAKLPQDKFAACAKKYGFPTRMESAP